MESVNINNPEEKTTLKMEVINSAEKTVIVKNASSPPDAKSNNSCEEVTDIIFSSFYSLNKSCSKFVKIGLDFNGDEFKSVIRISTNTMKHLQLTYRQWETLTLCFDIIDAFFGDEAKFLDHGKPQKLFLEGLDISFTTSYSKKAIIIEERPRECILPNGKKFKKIQDINSVVMHEVTYEGLKRIIPCVQKKIKQLEKLSSLTNEIVNVFAMFFMIQGTIKVTENYFDLKNYCKDHLEELHQEVLNKVTGWDEDAVSLGFNEIILFNFRNLAKYINKKFVHIIE